MESVNGEQKTSGYAFIEYETEEGANNAVQKGNLRKLDAQHILLVNHYEDIDRFAKVPDTYTPPKQSDYESKVSSNSWLLDELGRDMFVVRAGVETEVYYNDPFRKASDFGRTYKYGGEREKLQDKHWCDLYVGWSPKGSYLCTFHEPGLAIWGGEEFQKLGRFPHGHVQYFEFSPNEKYIVTCNGAEKECYIVWDVRQQKKLRGFERSETQLWPAFKWSHDDKFIARLTKDMISVYETPLMGLLDKKSIKIPNVAEFAWNPTKTQIAYWVPEQPPNVPATVAIVELPSRKIIREKHLYNVIDIKIHWHDHGDFLCVKVTRRKTKKTTTTNFEIFRMKVKEIPIEVTELEANIIAFAWEPQGSRFAIIHAQGTF